MRISVIRQHPIKTESDQQEKLQVGEENFNKLFILINSMTEQEQQETFSFEK